MRYNFKLKLICFNQSASVLKLNGLPHLAKTNNKKAYIVISTLDKCKTTYDRHASLSFSLNRHCKRSGSMNEHMGLLFMKYAQFYAVAASRKNDARNPLTSS